MASEVPDNRAPNVPPDDVCLSRIATAAALTAAGFPMRAATLASLASRPGKQGGPPYRVFNKHAIYRWGDVLDWAKKVAGTPRRVGSERLDADAA